MKATFSIISALTALMIFASTSTAYALHKTIRVPMVSRVDVRDQISQTPTQLLVPWSSNALGLTLPNASCRTDIIQYAYFKKVEVDFYLSHVLSTDSFSAKQQIKGYDSTTNPNSLHQYTDWTQDGRGFPYPFSTKSVNTNKMIIMQDDPGWPSQTINFPGNGVADEDVYDKHFRDKIKWLGPDGNYYDVYGSNDPDPYFGYWARYVDIWTAPGPPPNGTNNLYIVGVGGNY